MQPKPYTPSLYLPHEIELLEGLDEYQAKYVFTNPHGFKSVIANAGSGKTASLIARALFLLREFSIDSLSVTLLAFNNKAASEIKERWIALQQKAARASLLVKAKSFIEDSGDSFGFEISFESEDRDWNLGDINISTLHGFGYSVFRRLPEFKESKYSIWSEYSSIKAFKKIVRELAYTGAEEINSTDAATLYYMVEELASKNLIFPLLLQKNEAGKSVLEHVFEGCPEILDSLYAPESRNYPIFWMNSVWSERLEHQTDPERPTMRELYEEIDRKISNFTPWDRYYKDPKTKVDQIKRIIYRFYLDKYRQCSLSFSDMLLYPLIYLTFSESAREDFQRWTDHVNCDEAQDVDATQLAFLVTVFGSSFSMIGDPFQSLYVWRNSCPWFLVKQETINKTMLAAPSTKRKFSPEALQLAHTQEHFNIVGNYRSTPVIVDLFNLFAAQLSQFNYVPSVPMREPKARSVIIRQYPTIQDELRDVAREIADLKEQGVPLHDIMVLSRSNRNLSAMEPHLITMGIPYRLRLENRSPINQSSFRYLYSIYSVIINSNDVLAVSELFEAIKGFGEKYMEALSKGLSTGSLYIAKPDWPSKVHELKTVVSQIGNRKQKEVAMHLVNRVIEPILQVHSNMLMCGRSLPDINNFLRNLLKSNVNFAVDIGPSSESSSYRGSDPEGTRQIEGLPVLTIDQMSLNKAFQFTEAIYANMQGEVKTPRELLSELNDSEDSPLAEGELDLFGFLSGGTATKVVPQEFYNPFADPVKETPQTENSKKMGDALGFDIPYEMEAKPEHILFMETYGSLQTAYGVDPMDEEEIEALSDKAHGKKGHKHAKHKVLLSTIHSAKGAQAPYVFWVGLSLFQPIPDRDLIWEACCAYVAMSRPINRIMISSSQIIEDYNGAHRVAIENPFLEDIKGHVNTLKERASKTQGA